MNELSYKVRIEGEDLTFQLNLTKEYAYSLIRKITEKEFEITPKKAVASINDEGTVVVDKRKGSDGLVQVYWVIFEKDISESDEKKIVQIMKSYDKKRPDSVGFYFDEDEIAFDDILEFDDYSIFESFITTLHRDVLPVKEVFASTFFKPLVELEPVVTKIVIPRKEVGVSFNKKVVDFEGYCSYCKSKNTRFARSIEGGFDTYGCYDCGRRFVVGDDVEKLDFNVVSKIVNLNQERVAVQKISSRIFEDFGIKLHYETIRYIILKNKFGERIPSFEESFEESGMGRPSVYNPEIFKIIKKLWAEWKSGEEIRAILDKEYDINIAKSTLIKWTSFGVWERKEKEVERTNLECPFCKSVKICKRGITGEGKQRYGCYDCKRRFITEFSEPKLSDEMVAYINELHKQFLSLRSIVERVKERYNVSVHHETIRRVINTKVSKQLSGSDNVPVPSLEELDPELYEKL